MLLNFIAGAIIGVAALCVVRLVKARSSKAGRHEPPNLP